MTFDTPSSSDDPPTEEIYLELRGLEQAVSNTETDSPVSERVPAVADDDPTGIKARIARLRAILSDRGA